MKYIEQLKENKEFSCWLGASNEDIANAQEKLGINFPSTYKTFLQECGMCNYGDRNIFGIAKDKDKITFPIVEMTLEMRKTLQLDKKYLVIGYEDGEWLTIYDTETFKIYETELRYDENEKLIKGKIEETYSSFDEFFTDFITLGEDDE